MALPAKSSACADGGADCCAGGGADRCAGGGADRCAGAGVLPGRCAWAKPGPDQNAAAASTPIAMIAAAGRRRRWVSRAMPPARANTISASSISMPSAARKIGPRRSCGSPTR
jgi:hypothetical protein